MKKYILIYATLACFIMFFSCQKKDDISVPVVKQTVISSAVAPSIIKPVQDTSIVLLRADSAKTVNFAWHKATFGIPGPVYYTVQMDSADNTFAHSYTLAKVTTDSTAKLNIWHLDSVLLRKGFKANKVYSLNLRLKAEGDSTFYTAATKFNLTLFPISFVVFPKLYLVGDAVPSGWDIKHTTPMTVDPNNPFVFTYTGWLNGGAGDAAKQFKIPTLMSGGKPLVDWGCDYFMPINDGETDFSVTTAQLVIGGNPDYKWKVTTPGYYKISINIEETPTIHITSIAAPAVVYPNLYLVGDATPAGWNIASPTPMTADANNPFLFTWTGPLTAGMFKIPTAVGSWGCDYYMPILNDEKDFTKTTTQLVLGGSPDLHWTVTDAGTYKITINIGTNPYIYIVAQ
jgi:hypothetical protein